MEVSMEASIPESKDGDTEHICGTDVMGSQWQRMECKSILGAKVHVLHEQSTGVACDVGFGQRLYHPQEVEYVEQRFMFSMSTAQVGHVMCIWTRLYQFQKVAYVVKLDIWKLVSCTMEGVW